MWEICLSGSMRTGELAIGPAPGYSTELDVDHLSLGITRLAFGCGYAALCSSRPSWCQRLVLRDTSFRYSLKPGGGFGKAVPAATRKHAISADYLAGQGALGVIGLLGVRHYCEA